MIIVTVFSIQLYFRYGQQSDRRMFRNVHYQRLTAVIQHAEERSENVFFSFLQSHKLC